MFPNLLSLVSKTLTSLENGEVWNLVEL